MADIRLAKPEAGTVQNISAEGEARFIFDFSAGEGTLARDGDSLLITFADGAGISIDNFYREYNSENLPSFTLDGEEIGAEDFFAAMNEPDLMPAAGPGTGTAPTAGEGGRYHDYDNMALGEGIDHLWQLDWNTGRGFYFDDNFNGWGETVDALQAQANPVLAESGVPVMPERPADISRPSSPATVTRPETPEERPVENTRPEPEPWTPQPSPTPQPTPDPIPDPDPTPEPTPEPTPDPDPVTPPPDSPEPEVEVPSQPEPDPAPDDPDTPPVPDPDNPDPNPDDNDSSPFIPNMSDAAIVVDEGARTGKGAHKSHGHKNHGENADAPDHFFEVRANGEGGTLELEHGDVKITIDLDESGEPTATLAEGDEDKFFIVNGVKIEIGEVTRRVDENGDPVNDANGNPIWDVHYKYELLGAQKHDQTDLNPPDEDGTQISRDEAIYGDSITITITDKVPGLDGEPDVATGKLTVEVHDDVPTISTETTEKVVGDKILKADNTVEHDFGADNNQIPGVGYGHGVQEIVVRDKNGELDEDGLPPVLAWATGKTDEDGKDIEETDLSGLERGDTWSNGDVTVSLVDGKIVFNYRDGEENGETPAQREFLVEITDADNDTATTDVTLRPVDLENKPKDPDDPKDPTDPEYDNFVPATGKAHIVVDEAALEDPAYPGSHTSHGSTGQGVFHVDVPVAEGGIITLQGVDANGNPVILKGIIGADETDQTISFRPVLVDEDGNPLLDDAGNLQFGEESPSFMSAGVEISNFQASQGENGQWTVTYDYKLTGSQSHAAPDTPDPDPDTTHDYKTSDIVFDNAGVHITVEDGSGDKVTGQINVEVHDDVPVANNIHLVLDHHSEVFGNVLDNDRFGADGRNDGKYIDWTESGAEAVDGHYELTTAYGKITLFGDGSYTVKVTDTSKLPETGDSTEIKYQIIDGDKDIDDAVLTIKVPSREDNTPDHDDNAPDPTPIVGGEDNNIIIANTDMNIQHGEASASYNIAFVLDNSRSMGTHTLSGDSCTMGHATSRWAVLKSAVTNSLKDLQDYSGNVNITIITFNGGSEQRITWNNDTFKSLDPAEIGRILDTITPSSSTNYQAGLITTENWFENQHTAGYSQDSGYQDKVMFITDGDPTVCIPHHIVISTGHYYSASNNAERIMFTDADVTALKNYELDGEKLVTQGHLEFDVNGKSYMLDYNGNNYMMYVKAGNEYVQIKRPGGYDMTVITGNDAENTGKDTYTDSNGNVHDLYDDQGFALEAANSLKDVLNGNGEINVIGITSTDLRDENFLKDISTGDKVTLVSDANGINIALKEGFTDMFFNLPEADTIYGNEGNDVIFGDGIDLAKTIADHADELRAEGIDPAAITPSMYGEIIQSHPEWFDKSQDTVTTITGTVIKVDHADTILGGSGNDILYGQGGNDLLFGDGDDTADDTQKSTPQVVAALAGIMGAPGADSQAEILAALQDMNAGELAQVAGAIEDENGIEKPGAGNDILYGGTGEDALFGGGGDDLLFGGEGNDFLFGGSGKDRLEGGTGDDLLFGGEGNDYLDGGEGRDTLFGGEGQDFLVYDENDLLIDGGEGVDIILAANASVTLKDLLGNVNEDGTVNDETKPVVRDVEILLAGGVAGITSAADLVEKGVFIEDDRLVLDESKWSAVKGEDSDDAQAPIRFVYNDGGETAENGDALYLETTLPVQGNSGLSSNIMPIEAEDLEDGIEALGPLDIMPGHLGGHHPDSILDEILDSGDVEEDEIQIGELEAEPDEGDAEEILDQPEDSAAEIVETGTKEDENSAAAEDAPTGATAADDADSQPGQGSQSEPEDATSAEREPENTQTGAEPEADVKPESAAAADDYTAVAEQISPSPAEVPTYEPAAHDMPSQDM